MMKTLCVAVVVMSVSSLCQSASLACDKLVTPVDKGPDLLGTWHVIAMASDSCLITSLLKAVLSLSAQISITSRMQNIYTAEFKFKMYGQCANETDTVFYVNNTMFNVDINNAPTGEPDVLLQTGCPDCIVTKGKEIIEISMLLSRRKNVTAAELKEFEKQTQCLGWSNVHVFDSDYDFENCPPFDEDNTDLDSVSPIFFQRLKNNNMELIKNIPIEIQNVFCKGVLAKTAA